MEGHEVERRRVVANADGDLTIDLAQAENSPRGLNLYRRQFVPEEVGFDSFDDFGEDRAAGVTACATSGSDQGG